MSYSIRAMFPALCLMLILPVAQPSLAADVAPAKDAKAADAPAAREAIPSRSQEDALALERQLPQAEQQQLQAGADKFLALWKPANTDEPKGAVIVIPGAGETADWPNVVGPLRRKLPDSGWASLSVTMPDVLEDGVIARADEPPAADKSAKADSKPKDADAKPADAATTAEAEAAAVAARAAVDAERNKANAEQIFARIESAVAFAQQNKARSIVLVGHGSGAYWAARFMSEKPSPAVQKLVMVTAQETGRDKPSLLEVLPTLKVAMADYVDKDRPVPRQQAQDRLDASKRLKGMKYTQITLNGISANSPADQEQLAKRVRGWLESQ